MVEPPNDEELAGPQATNGVVDARVVRVDAMVVWLDIGAKFDAPLPLAAWTADEPSPKVGDIVTVFVDDDFNVDHRPLSIERLETDRPRRNIQTSLAYQQYLALCDGACVTGVLVAQIDDGYQVDYAGLKIFLPWCNASEAMRERPADFIGKRVRFRIAGQCADGLIVQLDSDARDVT